MDLQCLCCGYEQAVADEDEAFQAGWDTVERFGIGPLCELCPTTLYAKTILVDGQLHLRTLLPGEKPEHELAHERWRRDGRPTKLEGPF